MSGAPVRLALDVMGADHRPETLLGALEQLDDAAVALTVVGSESLRGQVNMTGADLCAAATFLEQGDTLVTALRHRPGSSMRRALELLAAGQVDAVVSAGNTAALMALGRQLLRRVPGLPRPAICKRLHGKRQPVWLLDLGANIDCSAPRLAQFAAMGAALAGSYLARPARVGLLNIGVEVTKGPPVLAEAAALLAASTAYEFEGFVEAHELFEGRVDVIVSDGLLGNVALKAIEGTASMARHLLLTHVQHLRQRAGLRGWLLDWLLRTPDLADVYDPQGYNGATVLGLAGVVVKSHGRADADGFAAAARQAVEEVRNRVPQRVFDGLALKPAG